MKKQGRFLSNTFDPKHKDAQKHITYSFQAYQSRSKAMQLEWEQHLAWINRNIIGPPKASATYTQKQLEDMNLVGIYAAENEQ